MKFQPALIGVFLFLVAHGIADDDATQSVLVRDRGTDSTRVYQLQNQVDLLADRFLRWPREAVDAGHDPIDLLTWERSNDPQDRLALVSVKLDLIEPRVIGLDAAESPESDVGLNRLEQRFAAIQQRIKETAEKYSKIAGVLNTFHSPPASDESPPLPDPEPQPQTGSVEVLNHVPHFELFRVNDQIQEIPAATIRRVLDLSGVVLSQETIPAKAVFENVPVKDVQIQLEGYPLQTFRDWQRYADGSIRMTRSIR